MTIAAIATAPGNGSVAIIRLSGKQALSIANSIFSKDLLQAQSHKAYVGFIIDGEEKLDQALVLFMQGPHSFTGEDVVEIQCHGGSVLCKKILQLVLRSGATLAKPGEFSYRAYMNGKCDLLQAEAICLLIEAQNDRALRISSSQLQGALSHKIGAFKERLLTVWASLEALLDFPEEDIEERPHLMQELIQVQSTMQQMVDSFDEGKKLFDGIEVGLIGATNAGKSSLFNALCGNKRAIVSAEAGTTRDFIEQDLILSDYNIRFIDTAGIRDAQADVEKEGIARTLEIIQRVDFVLFVVDITEETFVPLNNLSKEKTLVVYNKVDIKRTTPKSSFPHVCFVSAKTEEGIDQLKSKLQQMIQSNQRHETESVLLTSLRHKELVQIALQQLAKVIQGMKDNVSMEFLCFDMRFVVEALGKILGEDVHEEVLDKIFSQFCLGK